MSRRRQAIKTSAVSRTRKFDSPLVSRLINTVMQSGKKSTAERIVYGAIDQIVEQATRSQSARDPAPGGGERQAARRGEAPPGGWRHLPGAVGSHPRTGSVAGHALAGRFRHAPQRARR